LIRLAQDDVKFDVLTPTPVCAGFSVSFEVKAADSDPNELVTLNIYDSSGSWPLTKKSPCPPVCLTPLPLAKI
jgi:hypothetical protein